MDYWNKIHICGLLAARYGYRNYLEITTSETGLRFREAQVLGFDHCSRLVYRHDGREIDGLPVTYSSPSEDIDAPLEAIARSGVAYDIILVDGHHTYDCASRDIKQAFRLLPPGGSLVVHDCYPTSREVATPQYHQGDWCGVSYKAYLDFVLGNASLNYLTIDTDYGCGIIMKPRDPVRALRNYARVLAQRRVRAEWQGLGSDYDATFAMVEARPELLRLGTMRRLRQVLR